MRNLTSTAAAESNAAWSANGSHVVFARQSTTGGRNGGVSVHAGLFVWAPGHGAPQRIASCDKYCFQSGLAWSPDDRRIAFVSEHGAIEVMNAEGRGVHTICDDTRCGQGLAAPMWSPDGRKLVFSNEGVLGFSGPLTEPSGIWIANADGSGVEKLTQPRCNLRDEQRRGCALDAAPTWSPDGRLIAFSRYRLPTFSLRGRRGTRSRASHPITTRLEVMDADGTRLHSIYGCGAGNWCYQVLTPAWAPDGKAIAYVPTVRRTSPIQITTVAGKTSAIDGCTGSRCLPASELRWSPDGEQLAFTAGGSPSSPDAWVIDRKGSALHRIATGVQWGTLAWVGDVPLSGAKSVPTVATTRHPHLFGTIAYDALPSSSVDSYLRFLTLGGRGSQSRDAVQGLGLEPTWSPSGQEIAFGATRSTPNTNIYVADRNGRNLRVLTHFRSGATQPAWSPDGRTLAFESGGIQLVSAGGGHIRSLATGGQYPSWSPTGSELVFQRSVGRAGEIALFTIRPNGDGLKRITNLPGEQRTPAWSPDGKEIAFEWASPGGEGLYLIRPDGTHLRRVSSATVPQGRPAWSPDNRYLAVISDEGAFQHSRILVIDVANGRVSAVATAPAEAADPSWSSR